MKKIPLYIESKNGHDTVEVEKNELMEEVESQLQDDKWVTTEKTDGSSEILTQQDIPSDKEKQEMEEWADKFENVISATATNKAKGG